MTPIPSTSINQTFMRFYDRSLLFTGQWD